MGKNLKGKECGKGIYQRKDGLYPARYYDKMCDEAGMILSRMVDTFSSRIL